MQITMLVILLASLGLAALLGRSRERATAVELSAKPHLTDRLGIRYPKGWAPHQDRESDELPLTVTWTEDPKAGLLDARGVIVYQTDAPGPPDQLLGRFLVERGGELGRMRPFTILGHPGVIVRFERALPLPDDPRGRSIALPAWYAAVVVPDAGPEGRPLGIVIGVEGFATAGPAGQRLLRQLADGLTIRRVSQR